MRLQPKFERIHSRIRELYAVLDPGFLKSAEVQDFRNSLRQASDLIFRSLLSIGDMREMHQPCSNRSMLIPLRRQGRSGSGIFFMGCSSASTPISCT